jgi:thiol-disulfide isomerase/thioredoxin
VTTLLLAAVLAGEVDADGLSRLVTSHRGHPVVVSFWATWCAPCVAEFPELMAFARAHQDVVVLSVSIDDREDRAAVEAFLAERRPPFPVYLKAPGADEAFINSVHPEWSGAVPATVVFDRQGRRAAILQGEHGKADIESALARLKP